MKTQLPQGTKMSQTYKAQRRMIHLGEIPLDVAMLPDGSYRLSHTEVTGVVSKPRNSMLRFCRSKYLKSTVGKDIEGYNFTEELPVEGANRPISPVPIEIAVLYWQKCAQEANPRAQALVAALVKHSLYELADEAFGRNHSQQEKALTLSQSLSPEGVARIQAMNQQLGLTPSEPESQFERELKLKIRLAKLELERERLRLQDAPAFAAAETQKIGIRHWDLVFRIQKALGWSDYKAVYQLLDQLGWGFESGRWISIRVVGSLRLMPWAAFDELVEKIKRAQVKQH